MARSLPRKVLLGAAAVVGGVVLLLVVLVLVLQSGAATKQVVDRVLPGVSRSLGREVTLKEAELSLFPNPRVRLAGIAVAGREGEPRLVEAESLDVEVGLWALVRSLGKEVEVRAFTLVKPSVNLVKAKDGTWNYEGLGASEPGQKPGAPPAAQPPKAEPAQGAGGGGARVAAQRVRIRDASIRVIDRSLGKDDPGVALSDLDLEADGVGPGLPFKARVAAALADTKQNLEADLSVSRLPDAVPRSAADWPGLEGSVKLSALAIDRIRALLPADVGAIVRGGTASLDARLSTVDGPAYRVDGGGNLANVKLRGQDASGRFKALATWSPARPDAAKIDVTDLALEGPGVDLGGRVAVETSPMRATFALAGPLLDLDAVMGLLPESAPEPAAEKPAAGAPSSRGEVVPEATRRQIQGAVARGTIEIGKLRGGRVEATDVKARAVLSKGKLTLEQMDAAVFGGKVSASGTEVSLAEKEPTWKLAAKLSRLDLGKAMAAFSGRSPLVATVNGDLEVSGAGTVWEKLRDALTGLAALAIKDGTLATTDLGDEVLGGLAKGLEAAGQGGLAKRVGGARGGKTQLKDLAGKFTVKDGFLSATEPLRFETDAGDVSLGGRIALDGRLDLEGTVAVPRKVLAQAISGIPLPETLDVPLSLGGTLDAPKVSVRADDVAKRLLKGQTEQVKKEAKKEAERAARKGVEGLLDRLGRKRR